MTEEQAIAQRLKNQVAEHKVIDTAFSIFALSQLSGATGICFGQIPLSMQRKFPELTGRQLAYLKELVAKG
ncbi:terminase small subunit [Escherichia coli]